MDLVYRHFSGYAEKVVSPVIPPELGPGQGGFRVRKTFIDVLPLQWDSGGALRPRSSCLSAETRAELAEYFRIQAHRMYRFRKIRPVPHVEAARIKIRHKGILLTRFLVGQYGVSL